MEQPQPAHGMRAFFTIWSGQLVSLIGSQLTGFALGVWVYAQTRSVLMLALVQVAQQAPYVLLSPIAGVFADRWNRRTAMIVSDFGAGLSVLLMLLFVRIPNPPRTSGGQEAKGSIWKEMRFGWDYITARKGLLALLLFFLATNFLSGVMSPLIVPLILDNWDAATLGYLSTLMGVGMLAGTLVMSAWGGGRRKIYTLLGAATLSGLFLSAVGLRASIPLIAVCAICIMFCGPFINASSQAIWQAKVAPDIQGRVFAVRRTIAWSSGIIAPLLAAPLADYIFKPSMAVGSALASVLGPIFGYGSSRGVGVLISLVGLLSAGVSIIALLSPLIRRVELNLPDHELAARA